MNVLETIPSAHVLRAHRNNLVASENLAAVMPIASDLLVGFSQWTRVYQETHKSTNLERRFEYVLNLDLTAEQENMLLSNVTNALNPLGYTVSLTEVEALTLDLESVRKSAITVSP